MRCIVTAGPTYEKLDDVRRLTNFSTGRLGIELAGHLTVRGHEVVLLVGEQATWPGERRAATVESFSTTQDLLEHFERLQDPEVGAVFHVAAVSDFAFGRAWERAESGGLRELRAGKLSTRLGNLVVELVPTPKLIGRLRGCFPRARLVGWKYEVDGDRAAVLAKARQQLSDNHTDACVANGRAYGEGFGVVTRELEAQHVTGREELFALLEQLIPNSEVRNSRSERNPKI